MSTMKKITGVLDLFRVCRKTAGNDFCKNILFDKAVVSSYKSAKREINSSGCIGQKVTVKGWVKSIRQHKDITFVHINNGISPTNVQVVAKPELVNDVSFGSCVEVVGKLQPSQGSMQKEDVVLEKINILGHCDPVEYPFKARQRHPADYIRQHLHLRPRTNTFSALLRIRSEACRAFHDYFLKSGYCHIHTPIITSNDCEGAGEVFQVEPSKEILAQMDNDESNNKESDEGFFGVPAFLTVSGQLHLEVMTGAFSKVYTFGPTFRAENSRGRHHLSEFYMAEAEIAFVNSLEDIMKVIEELLKFSTEQILNRCETDVALFHKYVAVKNHKDVIQKLLTKPFVRLPYTEAIHILSKVKGKFKYPVHWGCDLQKEHERYLVQHCDNIPVFIMDFPESIKPFYARINENDDKEKTTAAAVDLLGCDVGELCGGSLREERLPVLEKKLNDLKMVDQYQWYLDLRRYGTVPHGGFGIGFERYLQMLLGESNIKDVIPFPRSTHNCKM